MFSAWPERHYVSENTSDRTRAGIKGCTLREEARFCHVESGQATFGHDTD